MDGCRHSSFLNFILPSGLLWTHGSCKLEFHDYGWLKFLHLVYKFPPLQQHIPKVPVRLKKGKFWKVFEQLEWTSWIFTDFFSYNHHDLLDLSLSSWNVWHSDHLLHKASLVRYIIQYFVLKLGNFFWILVSGKFKVEYIKAKSCSGAIPTDDLHQLSMFQYSSHLLEPQFAICLQMKNSFHGFIYKIIQFNTNTNCRCMVHIYGWNLRERKKEITYGFRVLHAKIIIQERNGVKWNCIYNVKKIGTEILDF